MQASDLSDDERGFLVETTDFECSFRELIEFVHYQYPELSLSAKFSIAQAVAENLIGNGILRCVLVKYTEVEPGKTEIVGADPVTLAAVRAAWSNPSFWQQEAEYAGSCYVGVEYQGVSKVALEPTEAGEVILDEIFATLAPNNSLQGRRP